MSTLSKSAKMFLLSPLVLPKKIRFSKKWKINNTDMQHYWDNITKFHIEDLDLIDAH